MYTFAQRGAYSHRRDAAVSVFWPVLMGTKRTKCTTKTISFRERASYAKDEENADNRNKNLNRLEQYL